MINQESEIERIWDEIYALELQLARLDEEIEILKRSKNYYKLIKSGERRGEISFQLWILYNLLFWLGEDIDIQEIAKKYLFSEDE